MEDARLTTHDRFQQVSWLRELAGNIAWNMDEGTAEEMVDFWLDQSVPPADRTALPEWFDDNDRRLLCAMVQRRIA